MATQPQPRSFTYRDYLNTPDDVRYQLIEGQLVREPAPTTTHQTVLVNLTVLLAPFVKGNGLGRVFAAPTDVYLSDTNVVQPDVLFVSAARAHLITERDVHGAPDLAIEVASPSTERRDRQVKREIYARHGVSEYWLVHPVHRTVETFRLEDGRFAATGSYRGTDAFTTPLLPGLRIELDAVFGC